FDIVWRYFSWTNQTLATIVLWSGAVYLARSHSNKAYLLPFLPAIYMTTVTVTYILVAPEGFRLSSSIGNPVGIAAAVLCTALFIFKVLNKRNQQPQPV
ncbi:MAG TPA: carbon starvation protein A, partial [Succinivibrionaceae bacterium]|nr:carbon starvation protein A [Succinivibrionaceae bacterium]